MPVTGEGYDHNGEMILFNQDNIAAFFQLDSSRDFWIGYENGGFSWPADVKFELIATLYLSTGEERQIELMYSESSNRYYVLFYRETGTYADANGEHLGQHPCRVFWITSEEYQALRASIGEPYDETHSN